MAGQQYYNGGAPGLTAMANSNKWGNTPGAAAIYKYNDNGADKFWVPNSYGAGNAWSNATLDPSKMQGLGGMAKSFSTSPNTSNPYGQNYNQPGKSYEGYSFNTMPTIGDIEGASTFNPGEGGNVFMDTWSGPLAVGAAALGGAMLGPGSGGTSAISGGGTSALSGTTAGGALATGTGVGTTGMGMGGVGAGTGATAATSAIPSYGVLGGGSTALTGGSIPAATGAGIFDSLVGGAKDLWSGLSGAQKLGGALGAADLALRYKQGQDLQDIAGQAADRGDALKQPERLPYQALLNDYMVNGKPLTDQPMIKAQQDMADRQMKAYMAKMGQTGAGDAPLQYAKGMNEALNASAMPYLQQLSGNAGFGFGPGYSGNIYGQYASQATGALPQGLESLARGMTYNNQSPQDFYRQIFNSQQQMQGMGPGSSYVY